VSAWQVGFADVSDVEPAGTVVTEAGVDGFTDAEMHFFQTLDTPGKVQDYLVRSELGREPFYHLVSHLVIWCWFIWCHG
jgi:hypothetical protein